MKQKNTKPNAINGKALDSWLGRDPDKLFKLVKKAGLSVFTIELMRKGRYPHESKQFTRDLLLQVTGIPREQLFPFTGTNKTANQV